MKPWQIVSAIVVLVTPLLVLLYDGFARQYGGQEATITYVIQQWQRRWPELPCAAGGLFVWLWLHLFLRDLLRIILN